MSQLTIMSHPLIQHKITLMRCATTSTKDFRELISELAMLIGYEASKELKLQEVCIQTPITKTMQYRLTDSEPCVVPILRAGLQMTEGFLKLIPNAKVGHIGLKRDENTLSPLSYMCKLPSDISQKEVFLLDPMLATGGSAAEAIQVLKNHGVKTIHFLCIIASPEGAKLVQKEHPDVKIFIGAMDEKLNENGYIVPGLGDAGDRIYGTID